MEESRIDRSNEIESRIEAEAMKTLGVWEDRSR